MVAQTCIGHLRPWVRGNKTVGKCRLGVVVNAKQQKLWQIIIMIKTTSIKWVNHCLAATFLYRWWNLFRDAFLLTLQGGALTKNTNKFKRFGNLSQL